MTLLRDIQDASIDANVDITVVLRKCKVLAVRLGNEDFKKWVDSELNGYDENAPLPDYRVFEVTSKGHFAGPAGSGLRNVDIPLSCLPEKSRENFRYHRGTQPISAYVSILNDSEAEGGSAQVPWPPELVAYVGQHIYQYMNCIGAWQVIPRNIIASLIDSVRNRILNFVLEIESENPDAGDAPQKSNPIPQEKVSQIYNTYISGNVQNVATGSSYVTQSGEFTILQNDIESLFSYLRSFSIDESDIQSLKNAIDLDAKENQVEKSIGPRVTSWMSKMMTMAAKGVWKVSSAVAASVLTKGVNSYYGFD